MVRKRCDMQETVNSTAVEKYTLASFFAGVGGIELGFEETGEFSTVYANEFDKNARITYSENFGKVPLDPRDIREVEAEDVPDVDIITGGFPCQAFSVAGYRKGFEDERGDLFFDLLRIIKNKNPRVIFIENVKNMVGHDHGNTFKVIRESLVINGYHLSWDVLNSSDYGDIPQNRERIYIVGFRDLEDFENFEFPGPIELDTTIHDLIDYEDEKDEAFYYREGKQPFYDKVEEAITSKKIIYQWRRKYVRENKSGLVPTLTANMGTGGHNVPIIYTDHGIRKLTPRETFNVQGYSADYRLPDLANSHLYKQAGNSVVVPVIERIANEIAFAINQHSESYQQVEIPQNDEKYAIIYTEIHERYSGISFVERYIDSKEELDHFIKNNISEDVPLLNNDEYIRLIKKGQSATFYMYTEM